MGARHRKVLSLQQAAEWGIVGVCVLLSGLRVLAQTPSSRAVQVTTPEEFQEQVRLGTPHIVITEHLNMTATPRFSESTIMDQGLISIVKAGSAITQTIRGNCTGQPSQTLDVPRKSNTQCVILVREDFLEVPTEGVQAWIYDLYVQIVRWEDKKHSTLIGVHGGDVYLTGMTFVGDNNKARCIDVKENRKLYVSDSIFTGFQKDRDGVVRLEAGAIATFANSTFERNTVQSGKPDTVAAGPVAGLKFDRFSQAAAVWFQSCVFEDSNTGAVPGEVSVESRECRVYANTLQPNVWDLERSKLYKPWLLAPVDAAASADAVDVFQGIGFPTEADGFFERATAEQASATGLPAVTPRALPEGTQFFTRDPYAGDDSKFWTGRNIALVVGLGGTFIVLAIGVLIWYFCYFKPEGETEAFAKDKKDHLLTYTDSSVMPSMHASPYGAPSSYNSHAPYGTHPTDSALIMNKHMVGSTPSMSSHSSHPPAYGANGPYASHHPLAHGGHPYQSPAPYNSFERQSSAAGSDHRTHASHPHSPSPVPYGIPGAYGVHPTPYGSNAGSVAGSNGPYGAGGSPTQAPQAPYGAEYPYGAPERATSNAASSVPAPSEHGPQMYGSVHDSAARSAMHTAGAGSSMVTASEANQSAFGTPHRASPTNGATEAPIAGGAVESTVDDTGVVPQGIEPNWQSNPEAPPTKLDANGRVILGGSAAAAAVVADNSATRAAATNDQHQQGVPHTATVTGLTMDTPQKAEAMMDPCNTTDARLGPFSANNASQQFVPNSSGTVSAAPGYDSNNGAAGVPTSGAHVLFVDTSTPGTSVLGAPAAEKQEREVSERDMFLPRVPYNRSATYVFDKTVAPDQDIADITHDKVADMLEDVFAAKALFHNRYETLGSVHQRLGGSGIVQFARATDSNLPAEKEVVLKFYIKRAAFDRVAGMFATPAVKPSMGAMQEVVSNNEEEKTGGCVLPPCVIMKRGENLEEWALRLRPNLPTALNALCALADLLKTLHAAGYVYYGFKPNNVAWFSEEKKWMLIDFACAARKGMRTGLSFALNYAAPEIILAQEAGSRTLAVDSAADIWALGVTAYELLSGARTFAPGTPTSEIRNMISGRLPLPWEEHEPKQLRTLRHSVMSCLARNPADRPAAADLHSKWRNLLDFAAVKHTEVSS